MEFIIYQAAGSAGFDKKQMEKAERHARKYPGLRKRFTKRAKNYAADIDQGWVEPM